jgi:hypothetical protein
MRAEKARLKGEEPAAIPLEEIEGLEPLEDGDDDEQL